MYLQIATVHRYHNDTNQVFDVMPIKKNNIQKRDLNNKRNRHVIFKRNALNDLPLKSFQDIIDYQIFNNLNINPKKYS